VGSIPQICRAGACATTFERRTRPDLSMPAEAGKRIRRPVCDWRSDGRNCEVNRGALNERRKTRFPPGNGNPAAARALNPS